jgi:hypothetical protein
MPTMIKTQIIHQDNKPIAVLPDYEVYKKMQEKVKDYEDYLSAVEKKMKNEKWVGHEEIKNRLGL